MSRLFWLSIVYSVLAFVLLQRMFELQIVKGNETEEKQNYYKVVERYIPSTRGLIFNKNGELLAYNELSFSILLEDSAQNSTNAAKNESIHKMVKIIKQHGYELELDFAIEIDENGELVFNVSGTAEQRFKKNAYGLRSVNNLSDEQKEATAEEVFNFLRHGNKQSAMFQVSDEYTLEELLMVRDFVVMQCNALAEQMERDAEGNIIYTGDMEAEAVKCMQAMGEEYEQLSGFYPEPKKIYFSEFLSQQYMQGYFFPFSMEANYNQIMCIMNKPATMCHELAHLKGFIQEDEANLIGYLACIQSDDLFFKYSGYLSVLNYLDNDFYDAVNRDKTQYLSQVRISAQVRKDNEFLTDEMWEKVEKKAVVSTETVDKISDEIVEATLVINGVEDGMLSYCRVVGLLLDYYAGQPEEIYLAQTQMAVAETE